MYHRAIFHDEEVYPDPHAFNPDRFLTEDGQIDPSVPDPEHRVFGSGRRLASAVSIYKSTLPDRSLIRICPGRHFALKVVFIAIARILATLDILPLVDENGKPRVPQAAFTQELIWYANRHVLFCPEHQNCGVLSNLLSFHLNSHPMPFECTVKPRSDKSMMLVKESLGKSS